MIIEKSSDEKIRIGEENLREAQERLRKAEEELERGKRERAAEEQKIEEELEKRFGPSIKAAEARARYYRGLADRLRRIENRSNKKEKR